MKKKVCGKCNIKKLEVDFYIYKDKYLYRCKDCIKEGFRNKNKHKKESRIKNRDYRENEYWACLVQYKAYEISTDGRVYSVHNAKYLKSTPTIKGYLMVKLYSSNIIKKTISVHRLVALSFIDNPCNKLEVHHINYNKKCNTVENLTWYTCKENINDSIIAGVRSRLANLKTGMFTESQVIDIRKKINDGENNQTISKYYNCNHSTISKIRRGVNYSNIK